MILRGIDFGNVFNASGARGFFGEGYLPHRVPFRHPDFAGVTFVSKTATQLPKAGNMWLSKRFTPINPLPRCIRVKFSRQLVLNSVGLSNPGIQALLATGQWQQRKDPFLISVQGIKSTSQQDTGAFCDLIEEISKHKFNAPYGLEINLSCPNDKGADPLDMIAQTTASLKAASPLNVPLVPKYSIASAPIEAIMQLNDDPHCDAICVSNTVPYNWEDVGKTTWGKKHSPLKHLGGGGLSGAILRPYVCNWIRTLRNAGFTKPINGGGGILSPEDVDAYRQAGASSVFLGSVAILKPRNMTSIIARANKLSWN